MLLNQETKIRIGHMTVVKLMLQEIRPELI